LDNQGKMQVFRKADAPMLMDAGCMTLAPMTDEQTAGIGKLIEAGFFEGDEVKVLVNMPGFSLTHVWFKKDYPLLLHSHDCDCLYHVTAGSLTMGTETLGPGDSFFVPANAAYTYAPGPEGVEVLEFRHATNFDFRNYAKNAAYYEKAAEAIAANREAWSTARPPSAAR
jgi:mannose-6-phosphate isomerase-like protein (cupin superfamily)